MKLPVRGLAFLGRDIFQTEFGGVCCGENSLNFLRPLLMSVAFITCLFKHLQHFLTEQMESQPESLCCLTLEK